MIRTILVPTGEEGSVTRRNLAGKKGKASVSSLRVFPRHFPQDPSTRRERKSWRNYHTLGRRHSSDLNGTPNFPSSDCSASWAADSNFGPTGDEWVHSTTETSTPRPQLPTSFPFSIHFFSSSEKLIGLFSVPPSQAWLWNAFQSLHTDGFHCI